MDASGAGIGRLDCYEDMFKEITRKLYGEDPDHRTSNVQNEFETASEFTKGSSSAAPPSQDEDNASDSSWTLDDEPVKGCAEGTRIAAYRASTSTWRCYECGECMGGGPREMAEHFTDLHSSRLVSEDSGRGRHQGSSPPRNLGPQVEEIAAHLARFRERAERLAPPSRRTQMTQTIPATLMPVVTSSFLQLQDLPAALAPTAHLIQSPAVSLTTALSNAPVALPAPQPQQPQHQPQHHHQPSSRSKRSSHSSHDRQGSPGTSTKRYKCNCCSYSTDRRDLYTRHENIHREEKPFHCYICFKPFSRADHVKKHFLRMHKGHKYELARIRTLKHSSTTHQPTESNNNNNNIFNNSRCSSNASSYPSSLYSAPTPPVKQEPSAPPPPSAQPAPPPPPPSAPEPTVTTYHLQPPPPTSSVQALYQAAAGMSTAVLAAAANSIIQQQQQQQQHQQQPEAAALTPVVPRRPTPKSASSVKSGASSGSSSSSSAKTQERRYTCCYCSWSGVDNWCLKRHLNTHTKPFACALCEYKAARAERLATHVLKVHNRRQCSRCSFVVDDLAQLQLHQLHVHRVSNPSAASASNSDRSQQQVLSLHSVVGNSGSAGGGRAPPGPPVFPPPSAAIAPATTVIPPTTMLGSEIAATPDYWEQKSPVASHFTDSMDSSDASAPHQGGSSRRKQTMPRKCILEEPATPAVVTLALPPRLLRCLLCPKHSLARRFRYFSWRSLRLHKLTRHARNKRRGKLTSTITLRAVVTAPFTKDTCSKPSLSSSLTKVTSRLF